MGYPDGYYYGQGRIICDTSTFSVGDTIRVRSMTDSSKIWDKQVVTVGTALVFTVPCYDYYKICTVQDIGGVATEIGGVYKTVDYGQTLFINVLDKTTLGGIQGILNAHQEGNLLSIGDEVTITVNGADWVMQVAGIDIYSSHEVIFTSKNVWTLSQKQNNYSSNTNELRLSAQSFYSGISNDEKQYIKQVTRNCKNYASEVGTYTDYCYVLGRTELDNVTTVTGQIQMPLFVTQASRIKMYNGSACSYWTSDWYDSQKSIIILSNGSTNNDTYTAQLGVVPSFTLKADS